MELAKGIRIIDGQPASEGQFPYQVAVTFTTNDGTFFCGGSLLNRDWILTAGHCVNGATQFNILLGGIYINGDEGGRISRYADYYYLHEEYDPSTLYADVGVVHMSEGVDFNDRISPVGLSEDFIGEGVSLTVSGYGATSDGSGVSNNLNYVSLTSIGNSACSAIYGGTITDGTICATGNPNHSTCSGDSGGPLVVNNNGNIQQVGVVSWVYAGGCGAGYPSGYSRVSYYREWIRARTGA